MRNYCWNCHKETVHDDPNQDIAHCTVCHHSNWTDNYPILESELPSNPLIAARQAYQKEKHTYYRQRGEREAQHG